MLVDSLLLILGLVLIVHGGELFVGASVRIAEFLRMPRVVIGSTLVSLATTTPELVVSMMAGAKGESELAVGNAVGSCICNIGLVFGMAATLRRVDIHLKALRTPLIAMFACGILLFLMTLNLVLARWQGMLLIAAGLAYFVFDFWHHACQPSRQEVVEATALERDIAKRLPWKETRVGSALQFLLGAGIVVFGSKLLVDAAISMAATLGIPSIVIGLTVIAVGTSLPELVTAITSSRQAVSDLALGNVLGANIANLTLIVGAAATISPVSLGRATQLFNFPAMLAVASVLLWMLFTDRRVTRREGAVLLCLYGCYLAALLLLTATHRSG
jgi:cation:H+ antiporter